MNIYVIELSLEFSTKQFSSFIISLRREFHFSFRHQCHCLHDQETKNGTSWIFMVRKISDSQCFAYFSNVLDERYNPKLITVGVSVA